METEKNFQNELIHPDIQKAIDAIHLPKVQNMMKELSKYGLAITVPHMHSENGNFVPLPHNKISCENKLQVSFRDINDPSIKDGIVVGWRWNGETETVCVCRKCYYTSCPHH